VAVVRGLYVVVDRQAAGTRSLTAIAAEAIDGGATVIQLRDKVSEGVGVYLEAVELQAVCASRNALFVMNDYAYIAVLVGAGGLHIGQQDIPLGTIRRLLPLEMVVGVSCETEAEVCQAVDAGADYIAVGAVFPTTQKDVRVVTGTELIRRVRSRVGAIPLVTIGGIGMHNVESVIEAGADAAAVIGAVVMQPDVRQAAEQMAQTIQHALERRERDG
jgi:thiamine-phosphate pyrophosphorylase